MTPDMIDDLSIGMNWDLSARLKVMKTSALARRDCNTVVLHGLCRFMDRRKQDLEVF